jgi:HEPN domain-containing protein
MRKKRIDPVLFEKIVAAGQRYAKVSAQNHEIANKWIEIAENDITVAKLLLNEKHYSACIYHIQQGYEKLIKGYYILSGRYTPDQAHGHKFILDKLKLEINNEDINGILKLSSSMNENSIDLTPSQKGLELLEKSEEDLRNISNEDIQKIITVIENIENNIKSKKMLEDIEKKTNEKAFFSFVKHFILKITGFRVRDSQVREAIEENKIIDYLDDMITGIRIHYFGILTYTHFSTPRYPSEKNSNFNYYSYNKNLGIVQNAELLINNFNDLDKKLKRFEFVQNNQKGENL